MSFPLMPDVNTVLTSNVSIAYTDGSSSSANSFTYTFSSVGIGAAATDRIVAVCAAINATSATTYGISSITIGGVAATMAVRSSSNKNAAIAYAVIPTGTTATIVVTLTGSGTPGRCVVNAYRITGYNNSAPIVASAFSDTAVASVSASINVPGGAKAITSVYVGNNGANGFSMTEPFHKVASYFVESTSLGCGMSGSAGLPPTDDPPLPRGTAVATVTPPAAGDISLSVAAWW
jgi:hypothetical protein